MAALQRGAERIDLHDRAAARVQQACARFHLRELGGPDHVLGLRRFRNVKRDEVRFGEQLFELRDRAVVAHRELRHDVVEHHAHAERFSEHADLAADMAVADDAEGVTADLVAPDRELAPLTRVNFSQAVAELARQHHDLGEDELGDRAGVRERGVERRHTGAPRAHEIDLIRADAKRADRE